MVLYGVDIGTGAGIFVVSKQVDLDSIGWIISSIYPLCMDY